MYICIYVYTQKKYIKYKILLICEITPYSINILQYLWQLFIWKTLYLGSLRLHEESKPETLLKLQYSKSASGPTAKGNFLFQEEMYHFRSENFPQNVQIYSSIMTSFTTVPC